MKEIFSDCSAVEKEAKRRFCFPEFVMMENAAAALEDAVLKALERVCGERSRNGHPDAQDGTNDTVVVLCGSGNNGADGYALSRRLFGVADVAVAFLGEPKTAEAVAQRKMAASLGVPMTADLAQAKELLQDAAVIVDCLYGTGFHGGLGKEAAVLVRAANEAAAYRIACDIPSGIDRNGIICALEQALATGSAVANGNNCAAGQPAAAGSAAERCGAGVSLAFCADETVTMGALKTALFSDAAKDFCGTITTASLGIASAQFALCAVPDAFLLERADIRLPVRVKKSAHKGDFGHTAVVMGEKAGAAIVAGSAALSFGSGLVTEIDSGLCKTNFLMNPELMIAKSLPERASAVLLGSGLGRSEKSFAVIENLVAKVCEMKNPSVVLDADFFYYENVTEVLERLNSIPGARVILTPHPKELYELLRRTSVIAPDTTGIEPVEITFDELCAHRFEYAKRFAEKFSNLTLIAKGANTYICSEGKVFVCDCGTPVLAKAGSGDVLAGLCAALLAQDYDASNAAKTAVFAHAAASLRFEENFACTPLALVEKCKEFAAPAGI